MKKKKGMGVGFPKNKETNNNELEERITVKIVGGYPTSSKQIKVGDILFVQSGCFCGYKVYEDDGYVKFTVKSITGLNDEKILYVVQYCGNDIFEEMTTGKKIYMVDSELQHYTFEPEEIKYGTSKDEVIENLNNIAEMISKNDLVFCEDVTYFFRVEEDMKIKYLKTSREKKTEYLDKLDKAASEMRTSSAAVLNRYIELGTKDVPEYTQERTEFESELRNFQNRDIQKIKK